MSERLLITLMTMAIPTDKKLYQWRGNDGMCYSPIYSNIEKARRFAELKGLRPNPLYEKLRSYCEHKGWPYPLKSES